MCSLKQHTSSLLLLPAEAFVQLFFFGYVSNRTFRFEVYFVFGKKPRDSLWCFVVDLFPLSSCGGVLLTPSLCSNGV